jgi:hypothetical protein
MKTELKRKDSKTSLKPKMSMEFQLVSHIKNKRPIKL